MPSGEAMEAILVHGLPAGTPLMRALEGADTPLVFDNTNVSGATAGFSDLGVRSRSGRVVLPKSRRVVLAPYTFRRCSKEADQTRPVATNRSGTMAR